jgi:TonB family protein
MDVTEPGSGTPASGAKAGRAPGAGQGNHSAAAAGGSGALQPMTGVSKPSAEEDTDLAGAKDARATAMLGASPELMRSHLLFAPEPQYPEQARIAHIQGEVMVEALVGRDGSVVKAQAISGNRALREAAEKAVYGRRYQPYVVNDIPMAVRTLVTVNFRLP